MTRVVLANVNVPKQSEQASCWAAAVEGVTTAHGRPVAQSTLIQMYAGQSDTGGAKPEKALKQLGYTTVVEVVGKLSQSRVDEMEDGIRTAINMRSPVICGIETSSASLVWLDKKPDGKPNKKAGETYTMQHALVCYGYDDVAGIYYMADPAKPPGTRMTVTAQALFWGFPYMKVSQLGPGALTWVAPITNDKHISMKVVKIVAAWP